MKVKTSMQSEFPSKAWFYRLKTRDPCIYMNDIYMFELVTIINDTTFTHNYIETACHITIIVYMYNALLGQLCNPHLDQLGTLILTLNSISVGRRSL